MVVFYSLNLTDVKFRFCLHPDHFRMDLFYLELDLVDVSGRIPYGVNKKALHPSYEEEKQRNKHFQRIVFC